MSKDFFREKRGKRLASRIKDKARRGHVIPKDLETREYRRRLDELRERDQREGLDQ